LDPARWQSHLGRAWALEGLRRPRDARAEYEKVLAIEPRQEDALYGRALALKTEGELSAALLAFKEYVGLPKASRLKEAQSLLAVPALAEEKPGVKVVQEADRIVVRKRTVIDFNDVTVEGELTKPEGSYVLDRNRTRFPSLVRLRDNFNPELQKSADNLQGP